NDFGGTVGGPIVIPRVFNAKDKLFFFASYEGVRSATQNTSTLTVPSAAERAGDFSQTFRRVWSACHPVHIFDPFSTTPTGSGFLRTQCPGTAIPRSATDPVAARIVTCFPSPNAAGDTCTGANNYFASGASRVRTDLPSFRFDF